MEAELRELKRGSKEAATRAEGALRESREAERMRGKLEAEVEEMQGRLRLEEETRRKVSEARCLTARWVVQWK